MPNEVAIIEPIQPPSNPAQLPSLPVWLQQRSAALGSESQRDSSGRLNQRSTLPASMMLTSSEQAEVQRHRAALVPFTSLDEAFELRGAVMNNAQAHGVMIASLLLKGGAKLDQQSSDAFTEDYLDAIEDIPAWAVREAIRKWNRAESPKLEGKHHDYNWRPAPPVLRQLANYELAGVRARILVLDKLLNAVPLVEFSDKHRHDMLQKLQALGQSLHTMPAAPQHQQAAE